MASTPSGKLADNILHFARALRSAGVGVGPDRAIAAAEAAASLPLDRKDDFYWALRATLLSRPEQAAVFDAIFKLFWRDPQLIEKMMSVMLRETSIPKNERERQAAETRAEDALAGGEPPRRDEEDEPELEEIEIDARLTMAADERLKARDFEQMTAAELRKAKAAIAGMRLPAPKRLSRRTRQSPNGRRADWRRTLRLAMRQGGEIRSLSMRTPRLKPYNLVALCDISGSMSNYSRMLLHFMHALSNAPQDGWGATHSFVFGTRLTNITRHLASKDVDEALAAAGREAMDWEGGTRIGAALWRFNRDWSRRVLGQGAVVLLITDGLDRDDAGLLAREAERLRLSAKKLIWLNPLLRWEGFAPRAAGVRALLPQVDSFRAAHNIDSLDALAQALSTTDDGGDRKRLLEMMAQDAA